MGSVPTNDNINEQRFARFMAHLPGLAWIKDHLGRYVYANEAAAVAFGIPLAQLYGRTDEELFPPETARLFRRNDSEAISSPSGVHVVETLRHPNGRLITSIVNKFAMPGLTPEQVFVGGMAIDITERVEAERALRASEERLRLATSTGKLGVWDWDIPANRVMWSESLYQIHGVDHNEFNGTVESFAALVHPDDRAGIEQAIERALAGAAKYEIEFRALRPDGQMIWLFTNAQVFREGERAVRMIGATFDITDIKRAETIVHASEELFRRAADAAPVLMWQSDRANQCTWFNQPWLQFTGRTLEQEKGMGWLQGVHPDDREATLAADAEAVALRQPMELIYRLRRHDGEYRWVIDRGRPHFDLDGEFTGYVGGAIDINDLRAAQDAQATFAAIVESSDDAIISKGFDGIIRSWNVAAERMFGYTADEAIGRHITLIIPRDRHEEENHIISRLRRGERIDHFETVRVTKHGDFRDISLTISPIRDAAGRLVGASKIARDITQRKAAEAELRRTQEALRDADQRKDEFLATLAHELRNPLAPIRNALKIVRQPNVSAAAASTAHAMMERQLAQMVRLIDDLLDVARISTGKLDLRRQPIPLGDALRYAVEASQPLIDEMGHTLELDISADSLPLHADLTRLTQVFLNLLNNAAKYMERGGRIKLRAWHEGDWAIVSVSDEGIGIRADMLPRLFELFVQSERAISRSRGGLGVGLSLVKRLVELHGGSVTAQSEGLGRGSEFIVRLPLARAAVTAEAEEGSLTRPAARSLRVLIVDDNVDAATSLQLLLKIGGHSSRIAHDGHAAIAAAEQFRPEVMLLDIGLPGMSGFEVCRQIRRQDWGRDISIAALTGWSQEQDRHTAVEAGFDHYLLKPVESQVLERWLATISSRSTNMSTSPQA